MPSDLGSVAQCSAWLRDHRPVEEGLEQQVMERSGLWSRPTWTLTWSLTRPGSLIFTSNLYASKFQRGDVTVTTFCIVNPFGLCGSGSCA